MNIFLSRGVRACRTNWVPLDTCLFSQNVKTETQVILGQVNGIGSLGPSPCLAFPESIPVRTPTADRQHVPWPGIEKNVLYVREELKEQQEDMQEELAKVKEMLAPVKSRTSKLSGNTV